VDFPEIPSGRIQIIIDILRDLGLIEITQSPAQNHYSAVAVKEKKDLMSSKILLTLQ